MMHQACADIIPQSRMRLEVGPLVSFSPCYISGNEGLTPVPKLTVRRFPTTFHGVSRCDLQSLSLRPLWLNIFGQPQGGRIGAQGGAIFQRMEMTSPGLGGSGMSSFTCGRFSPSAASHSDRLAPSGRWIVQSS